MTEKRYSVWQSEEKAQAHGPEHREWQVAKSELAGLRKSIVSQAWRIYRHNDDGTVTDVTEQTTYEPMSASYDQGVEDGVKQERERIREALLSDGAIQGLSDSYWMIVADGWMKPLLAAICDRIGLGAVTTEESEK